MYVNNTELILKRSITSGSLLIIPKNTVLLSRQLSGFWNRAVLGSKLVFPLTVFVDSTGVWFISLRWKAGQKAWRFNLSHQTQHPNPTALLRAFLLTHRNYFTYHFKRLLLASIAIHTTTGKEPTAINCCESASDSFKKQWVEFWRTDSDKKKRESFSTHKTLSLKPFCCTVCRP